MIEEEDDIEFSKYSDLSYSDDDGANVGLYVNNQFVGDIKVWLDSEMDGREYICLNYTIEYLDTITKR